LADEALQLPSTSRDDGPSATSQRSDHTTQPQSQPTKLKVLQNIIDKVPLKMKLGSKIASQRQSYQKHKLKQLAQQDLYQTTKTEDLFSPQNMTARRSYNNTILPEISVSHDFSAHHRNPFSTLTHQHTTSITKSMNTSSTFDSRADSRYKNGDMEF